MKTIVTLTKAILIASALVFIAQIATANNPHEKLIRKAQKEQQQRIAAQNSTNNGSSSVNPQQKDEPGSSVTIFRDGRIIIR